MTCFVIVRYPSYSSLKWAEGHLPSWFLGSTKFVSTFLWPCYIVFFVSKIIFHSLYFFWRLRNDVSTYLILISSSSQWFQKRQKKAMTEALEKIKAGSLIFLSSSFFIYTRPQNWLEKVFPVNEKKDFLNSLILF